jgi:hypothetical protein
LLVVVVLVPLTEVVVVVQVDTAQMLSVKLLVLTHLRKRP